MSSKTKIVLAVVVTAIVACFLTIVLRPTSRSLTVSGTGTPTVFDNVNLTGALHLAVTPGNPLVAPTYGDGSIVASGQVYSAVGLQEGGVETLNATGTAYQLAASDIGSYSTVNFIATTSTTVTLPTASAMAALTNYLVNVGDRASWVFINATSTGGTITLASGTGFNLMTNVASTTANKIVLASSTALLEVIKTGSAAYQATVDVYK